MSDWNALTGERLAALVASGFESSQDVLNAVVKQADELCENLIEQQNMHVATLSSDAERTVRYAAKAKLLHIERVRKSLPAALGIYAGLALRQCSTDDQREDVIFLLARMADDLLQIGAQFMVGKDTEHLPASVAARKLGSSGGISSGSARLKQADELWRDQALESARAKRRSNPDITQDKLSAAILYGWPAGKWKPEFTTLLSLLRKWEQDKILVKRRKPERKKV